tara:strand:+ start:88 stop:498 length:411 start_codon:yes stop_codon:yes gene_type:complete
MTDPNAKPKYAIYDEAVGALTFLEANGGVSFSGRLKNNTTIDLPDDWVGKKPPEAVRTIDPATINVQLTPIGVHQDLFVKAVEWGKKVVVQSGSGGAIDCYYTVTAQLAVNDVPKNITRKVKVTDKQGDPHWEEVA